MVDDMMVLAKRWLGLVAFGLVVACSGESPTAASEGTDSMTGGSGTSGTTGAGTTGALDTSGSTGESGAASTTSGPDLPDPQPDPNDDIPPPDEEGCHAIYAQDLLPTFEVTIVPAIWEQLMWEWNNGAANEEAGVDPNPYHSVVEFKYDDVSIDDAAIRLRGNPTYWDPIPGDKMQFQIGFHTKDDDGRFLGIKRLVLEAATFNRHFLRDRLSLAFMRDVGIAAPCANNARLVVNGEYYGIFTNIEKLDELFLERVMEDPSGDLWKRANWELKTNEDTSNSNRLDAMRAATTPEDLFEYLDIEQALLTYAAEAVIPDSDGGWAGGLNFYMYDDPTRGKFMLLPWDLDNTFERFNHEPDGDYPTNPDPYTWEKPTTHGRPFYDISLQDPQWFELYIDIIDQILHEGYDPDQMLGWVDTWSAQIEDAVLADVNKPYDNDLYYLKLDDLREYIPTRYDFVDQWLVCWQGGGIDDGTGTCVMP